MIACEFELWYLVHTAYSPGETAVVEHSLCCSSFALFTLSVSRSIRPKSASSSGAYSINVCNDSNVARVRKVSWWGIFAWWGSCGRGILAQWDEHRTERVS